MNTGSNSTKITISLKKEIRTKLKKEADAKGLPLSRYIRQLLEKLTARNQ